MELSRSNLFDIVTQYRAAFADDDPLAFTTRDPNLNELALFQGWLMHRVRLFLNYHNFMFLYFLTFVIFNFSFIYKFSNFNFIGRFQKGFAKFQHMKEIFRIRN